VLEKEFSTIAGIEEMTSVSGQGVTRVTIQFALERDIDAEETTRCRFAALICAG
jgi:HAE1 family hydrophobic/amphiphilic exporter-1